MDLIKLEYHDSTHSSEKKTLEFSKRLLPLPYSEKSLFVIQVQGESMQPLILDKALVVADLSQLDIEHEKIYLVYKDNQMWIKKAHVEDQVINFVSINPDFSHLVYALKEVRVIAKALLTFTVL